MTPTHLRPARILRHLSAAASGLALALALAVGSAPAASAAVEDEDVFYQLGVAVGLRLAEFQLSKDELGVVTKGMMAAVKGDTVPEPTEEQMKRLSEIQAERANKVATQYLDKVRQESGARVTESGLIYFETAAGSGASPAATDTVKVHYHGTLANGAVFDSSISRGAPAEFPLNRVIGCWTEGVGMMKVGGKARLVCPPGLAYGERGAPPTIPGGAVLSFDVELIEIVTPESAPE